MTLHVSGGFVSLIASYRLAALRHIIFSIVEGSCQHLSIDLSVYSSGRTSCGVIVTQFLQPASLVKEGKLPVLWVFHLFLDLTSAYILEQRHSFQSYRSDANYWLYVAAYGKTSPSSGQLLFAVLKV